MDPVSFDALSLEMSCNMDYLDLPRACPLVEGRPFRYSVGFYRGRKRLTLAWFADESSALDYCIRTSRQYPQFKVDVLKSLF